ncbi:MAG TPA: hypothetical protein VLX61_11400 [Anaerolineales bacterium]|nr:hypothetical protein [Anaerolineales bacterium]
MKISHPKYVHVVSVVRKELGVKPLSLSRPVNGRFWGRMGFSWQAPREYYVKLKLAVFPCGLPLVDSAIRHGDRFVRLDQSSHAGRAGSMAVDSTSDALFHRQIHRAGRARGFSTESVQNTSRAQADFARSKSLKKENVLS